MKVIKILKNNNCKKMDNYVNFVTLDYRLNGFPVNRVMTDIRNFLENVSEKNIVECGTKRIFNKFLEAFNLKKEFISFVKERDASKEESYAPFMKKRICELLCNADELARIFETEEEDRTNKKHRRRIIKMVSYLNEIGKISMFFCPATNGVTRLKRNNLSKMLHGDFKREYPGTKQKVLC